MVLKNQFLHGAKLFPLAIYPIAVVTICFCLYFCIRCLIKGFAKGVRIMKLELLSENKYICIGHVVHVHGSCHFLAKETIESVHMNDS